MSIRMFSIASLALVALLLLNAVSVFGSAGPRSQLERSVSQILTVLQDEALQGESRRQELSDLVRQRFDFQVMSQYVLGPQWRQTSKEDRGRFIVLFSDLLEANYLGRIEAYTNEKVVFDEEQIDGRKAQVATRVLTGSTEIPIDYKLVDQDGTWLVYDVIVEGVSLVRTYRDSYREIARKEGMTGLLARMQEKLEEMRKGDTAG